MPYMPQVQLPDFTGVNQLFNDSLNTIQRNQAATGTQDLADRATLRGIASDLAATDGPGGLAVRNPLAIATAASMPVGLGTVNALSGYDANTAQARLAMMNAAAGQPDLGGGGGIMGGPATSAAPAPIAAPDGSVDNQFINSLARSEGGGTPGIVNKQGYNGQYQFGAPRLTDLHVYTPAPGEIGNGGKWNGKTQGTFSIPGFPDVRTQADFLANPDAQRAVMHLQVNNLRNTIANTPGAENLNPTGLLAVGHLGGPTGMVKFIQSNGAYNPGDNPNAPGGGTHLSDYYHKFSQGGPVALQQAYGHPQGPLPADHPAMPLLASNTGTAGMPQTATDAAGPATVSATPDAVQNLLSGYRQGSAAPAPDAATSVAADPSYLANRNAPAAGQTMSPLQAVQQARAELEPSQTGMPAEAANEAVRQRALAILSGAPAASPAPQAAPPGLLRPAAPSLAPPVPQAAAQPSAAPANGPAAMAPPLIPYGAAALQPGEHIVGNKLNGLPFPHPNMPGYGIAQMGPNGPTRPIPLVPQNPQEIKTPTEILYVDPHNPTNVLGRQPVQETGRAVMQPVPGGVQPVLNGHPVGPVMPVSSRDVQIKDYEANRQEASELATASQQAQTSQVRLSHMMDLAEQLKTGANGGTRAQWANLAQTYLPPQWAEKFNTIGPGGASAAQELEKLATVSAGQQERGVLGARGGIQAINLFKSANPGLEMQPDANRKILTAQRIGAQADRDYADGAVAHFNQQGDIFRNSQGDYQPLNHYEQQWNAQRNPQIYAAAMDAANGAPWEKWTKALKTDSSKDVQRVISIVRNAIPNAKIRWNDNTEHSVGVPQ